MSRMLYIKAISFILFDSFMSELKNKNAKGILFHNSTLTGISYNFIF